MLEDDEVATGNAQRRLGARLRAVREARKLSLRDVERRTNGRVKVGALGSYERGTRAVTVTRLLELAEIYGVWVGALLEDDHPLGMTGAPGPLTTVNLPARNGNHDAHLRALASAVRPLRSTAQADHATVVIVYEASVHDVLDRLGD